MRYFYAQRLDGHEPSHPIMAYDMACAREIAETVLDLKMDNDDGGHHCIVKSERADWLAEEIAEAERTWAEYQAINDIDKES